VALLFWLITECSSPSQESIKPAPSSSTSSVVAPTPKESTDARPAPTDVQVQKAFQAYINQRADSGVMLAQSVTSVSVNGGVVTVVVDAEPVVMETSPFDNISNGGFW
jgi:hypothetical protein